ncbi:MAG: ATP-dependent 6-phosphofructokinase [Rhodospirillaceae bacterium]|nr:ATP-dependent 6-phosphofructokinase [Rhodospirillaceae bacterium]MBT4937814.1 ATP-dependent 6-phosphofructokinase [Rhodospirillaceae bacterium]MBT5940348.1 ATP-dependent 6-phosphofructokinase [Rhodospirillaceae bacterium]MBT7267531.1 ATP-dependent 6-phosphofructokinase [Rhodospirillaceae bacterium]
MSDQKTHKTIGVLTSGGDCAGLNAVIRAVVHRAIEGYGWRVLGINDGTHGLMASPPRFEELSLRLFTGNILRLGGTILGTTNKGDPFDFPMPDGSRKDRSAEFAAGFKELGLDGLIGIGGDGSLDILSRLTKLAGIDFIGVPKTIDNDVPLTEFAVGFSTAVNTAVEALDRLQPTAASHERVMILEVMGRDAGHIALNAGIGGGADVILIPEIPYRIEPIAAKIKTLHDQGRDHALVVCSEAAHPANGKKVMSESSDGKKHYGGIGHELGEQITQATGAETRVTVLGHIQRGGTPSSHDRIIASAFGVRAVDLLAKGESARMVAWQHRQVVDLPLDEVTSRIRNVDVTDTLVQTARGLGISLGD